MAKQVPINQSSREEKIYPLDFSPALLSGVSVTDATLSFLTDNEEGDDPIVSESIDGNIVYVAVSNLSIGFHRIRCVATTDNDDLSPEIELLITVKS